MPPNVLSPEDNSTFRLARMLLLFDVAKSLGKRVQSVDRLAYYEFFSDNPFVVIEGDSARDRADRLALELAGFSRVQLAYASTGQRFASRRRRLQHDLARLVAFGLAEMTTDGYAITDEGSALSSDLRSVYADAYRASAEIVLRRLASRGNKALDRDVEEWLGYSWLLVDLLDEVGDAHAPTDPIDDELKEGE
ncbi:MAG: hypothetical protein BGO23_12085 [Solirubrobacterales bacterium 67-14]|nr:MAG: hypothetical protein BGO23_12085 [Solirubrobacterales bacterium 67-14]